MNDFFSDFDRLTKEENNNTSEITLNNTSEQDTQNFASTDNTETTNAENNINDSELSSIIQSLKNEVSALKTLITNSANAETKKQ